MLIKESQLMVQNVNPISLLAEATFLTESESMVQPVAVPVREMSRFGEGATMVHFADVERLAESHQVSYMDAMAAIAEANHIDASLMTVAVDEADLIVDPSLLNEMTNIVVAPLSESSLAYQYVTECIDAWSQMEDSAEVDAMLEAALVEDADLAAFIEANFMDQTDAEDAPENPLQSSQVFKGTNRQKAAMELPKKQSVTKGITQYFNDVRAAKGEPAKAGLSDRAKAAGTSALNFAKNNKGKIAAGAAGVAGAVALGAAILKKANGKPKSWIGQKIAALRNVYAKWMKKAQNADASVGGRIKAACGKLMGIIDKLMSKLQNAAG